MNCTVPVHGDAALEVLPAVLHRVGGVGVLEVLGEGRAGVEEAGAELAPVLAPVVPHPTLTIATFSGHLI